MKAIKLGPTGQNILAVLTEDFNKLSKAYCPEDKTQKEFFNSELLDIANIIAKTATEELKETYQSPADEYVAGIDLESEATPFQARLMVYGNKPISTFSILA